MISQKERLVLRGCRLEKTHLEHRGSSGAKSGDVLIRGSVGDQNEVILRKEKETIK